MGVAFDGHRRDNAFSVRRDELNAHFLSERPHTPLGQCVENLIVHRVISHTDLSCTEISCTDSVCPAVQVTR